MHKQKEKVLEYTTKWGITANADRCTVFARDEDEKNPLEFRWKYREDELLIVNCFWDAQIK